MTTYTYFGLPMQSSDALDVAEAVIEASDESVQLVIYAVRDMLLNQRGIGPTMATVSSVEIVTSLAKLRVGGNGR